MHLKAAPVWGVCFLWGALLLRGALVLLLLREGGGGRVWLGCCCTFSDSLTHSPARFVFAVAEGAFVSLAVACGARFFLVVVVFYVYVYGHIAVTHSPAGSLADAVAVGCAVFVVAAVGCENKNNPQI